MKILQTASGVLGGAANVGHRKARPADEVPTTRSHWSDREWFSEAYQGTPSNRCGELGMGARPGAGRNTLWPVRTAGLSPSHVARDYLPGYN
ncbi:hypothetical protein HBI70_016990 [Parastagonospora nodorum]|nr:hypothetical protein HBH51_221710 [Parastagonospora nodorum]KAH4802907.1 hypothetical protein HBH61_182440 [Parastagonospora nodorum]KAH5287252.1 hypothetical protein HBI70_016990 [Parastagonospora nodorum]KAH5546996.1 hypothetical protein HBI27_040790 [Parastagonospora nodorum]KAH6223537.1 hypothetical protein HBI15_099670 [Parastagonospora nodorum]